MQKSNIKTYTLHDLPIDERPRERLVKYGVESLSLQELLSIIFGRGVKGESVTSISQKLITIYPSLEDLSEVSIEELKKIKGLGLAKACQLKACFEISKRQAKEESSNRNTGLIIRSPKDIVPLLKEKIINFHKEYFITVSLNNRNKIIAVNIVSIGTLSSSLIHPRETFETAIKDHAAGIILCHNHPSGELKPSEEDMVVTDNLVKAGKLLGIDVHDHIIITKREWFSMKINKLM